MDAERPPRTAYRFDHFTLDLDRGALLAPDGAELPLRPKSFALLQFLVENAGRLLDRDAIMQAVWPDVIVTDDSITQCVGEIRRALGEGAPRLLKTMPRRGYLLAAKVEHAASDVAAIDGTPPRARLPGDRVGPAGSSTASGAERRQLTVLFCDLVGSTELAERLDPEDLGEIIRAYQKFCTAEIVRLGGHVAKYLGDGVLAYFGYPQAREDAAERAVRAGLAIIGTSHELCPGPDLALHVRIGIATGLVVSDLASEGGREEVTMGKPLHLAARLQAIAEPGTVIIAEGTRRLLGGLFALDDLGRHPLKGFTVPVQAWRVSGEGVAESRFEALHGVSLTPLVGRQQELTLLHDRWEQATEGEGQAVMLTGEPGIGKSRLVRALRDRLADEPHVHLGYSCLPHRRDSPLYPVIAHLERAAGFTPGDNPGQKLAKLEAVLAHGCADVARVAPLIASLLSIPSGGRYPPLAMSPQQQRERTLAVLMDQLAGLAAHRPVLLVWEDVHWADPSSLELLALAIDRLQSLPVLALVTLRPEFAPPWPGHTHITWLTLNRLSQRRCGRLVAGLAGGKLLPAVVVDQIVAKVEGVPLFIEELTKAVLESGLLRVNGNCYELDRPLPSLAIPATLHDSLMARLDRVPEAKEVAQAAACVGREFDYPLLAAVSPVPEVELRANLDRLVAAELVFRRGLPPGATYTFKHALVRDTAYDSLVRGKRQQLHGWIAHALEEHFPDRIATRPELLAHHFTEAGLTTVAVGHWRRAGQHAAERSANMEAICHLRRGLALLEGLPAGQERDGHELPLLMALGPLVMAGQWAAPELEQLYDRARTLAATSGGPADLFRTVWGWWLFSHTRYDRDTAAAIVAELLRLARGDPELALQAYHADWATRMSAGDLSGALDATKAGLRLYERETHGRHALLYGGHDPGVCGLGHAAHVLWIMGYPDQATASSEAALALARELGHGPSLAHALGFAGELRQVARDAAGTAEIAGALDTLAAELGLPMYAAKSAMLGGWALALQGRASEALARVRGAFDAVRDDLDALPFITVCLAEVCGFAGEPEEGLRLIKETLERIRGWDQRLLEAELLRLRGALSLLPPEPNRSAAEASFRCALVTARERDARMWELRAAVDLARLWFKQGMRAEARDVLSPVHDWFTEGFDTPDLRAAKRLIEKLH